MPADQKKIIIRIKKLFKLAENNSEENEALSARAKAEKLMKQHNITYKMLGMRPPLEQINYFSALENIRPNWDSKFTESFENMGDSMAHLEEVFAQVAKGFKNMEDKF